MTIILPGKWENIVVGILRDQRYRTVERTEYVDPLIKQKKICRGSFAILMR